MEKLAKYGTEYIFYIALRAAGSDSYQVNPTLAVGDVTVTQDGVDFGNIDTIPAVAPAGGSQIKVTVSVAELTGKQIQIKFSDAAGAEWKDLSINIETYAHANAQKPYFGEGTYDRKLNAANHNVPTSSGRRIRALGDVLGFTIVASGSNTALTFKTDLPSAKDNFYNDQVIYGVGDGDENEGAAKIVAAYNGTTKFITLDEALTDIPAAGDEFDLRPEHVHPISQIISTMLNTIVDGTYNIAKSWGKRLRGIEEYQGYKGGFIYIDTLHGSAGDDPHVNGTVDNKVDNLADALSLAESLNMHDFEVAGGSSLTFISSQDNNSYHGHNWMLALGGQSIASAYIHGAIDISGIATAATPPKFEHCVFNGVTIPPLLAVNCGLGGDMVAGTAGDYVFQDCYSKKAGFGSPSFDSGVSLADVNFSNRNYSGGIELLNMGQVGIDKASIEGEGQVIINDNCVGSAGSQIAIRGHQTRSGGGPFLAGGGVIDDDARFAVDQFEGVIALIADIDTSSEAATALAAAFTEIKGAGWANETLKALKDAIDLLSPTGAHQVIVQMYKEGGTDPMIGVTIDIWNETLDGFLEQKTTDSNGQILVSKDSNTYKFMARKAASSFSDPYTIVVTGPETFIRYGTNFTIPVPSDPDQCNVYCNLKDIGLNPEEGVLFTAVIQDGPVATGNIILDAREYSQATDVQGVAILTLAKNQTYTVSSLAFVGASKAVEVVIADEDTLNLSTIMQA